MFKNFSKKEINLVLLGCLGAFTFALGHGAVMFENGHINSLLMGSGTGLIVASLGLLLFYFVKKHPKDNKEDI